MKRESVTPHQPEADDPDAMVSKPPLRQSPGEDSDMSLKRRAGSQARRPKLEVKQQVTEKGRPRFGSLHRATRNQAKDW